MVDYKKLDELIDEYQKDIEVPEDNEPTYTYVGEYFQPHSYSSDNHSSYNKQFTSTEFAVNITEAISNAHRVGLSNKDIAEVLSKILDEVRSK